MHACSCGVRLGSMQANAAQQTVSRQLSPSCESFSGCCDPRPVDGKRQCGWATELLHCHQARKGGVGCRSVSLVLWDLGCYVFVSACRGCIKTFMMVFFTIIIIKSKLKSNSISNHNLERGQFENGVLPDDLRHSRQISTGTFTLRGLSAVADELTSRQGTFFTTFRNSENTNTGVSLTTFRAPTDVEPQGWQRVHFALLASQRVLQILAQQLLVHRRLVSEHQQMLQSQGCTNRRPEDRLDRLHSTVPRLI